MDIEQKYYLIFIKNVRKSTKHKNGKEYARLRDEKQKGKCYNTKWS